jgi:hypothetical protein
LYKRHNKENYKNIKRNGEKTEGSSEPSQT